MNAADVTPAGPEQHDVYIILIKGHLDPRRAVWFEGMTVTLEPEGVTRLAGPVLDQAALHGLLRKVRDLGMPLLAVNLVARQV